MCLNIDQRNEWRRSVRRQIVRRRQIWMETNNRRLFNLLSEGPIPGHNYQLNDMTFKQHHSLLQHFKSKYRDSIGSSGPTLIFVLVPKRIATGKTLQPAEVLSRSKIQTIFHGRNRLCSKAFHVALFPTTKIHPSADCNVFKDVAKMHQKFPPLIGGQLAFIYFNIFGKITRFFA